MDDTGGEREREKERYQRGLPMNFKQPSSRAMSSFNPAKILPENVQQQQREADPFGSPAPQVSSHLQHLSSRSGSESPPSIFDNAEESPEAYTDPTNPNSAQHSAADEPGSYDLKAPAPSVSYSNIEVLSERLFSVDHLNVLLRDNNLASRFTKFISTYRPQSAPALARYLETRKAITAIEYANAIAANIPAPAGHPPYTAATVDPRFEARSRRTVDELVSEALPGFITQRLVVLITECLVKEITGNNAPIMREMVPGLAEVYCVTDPSLPDNPIVYASEEFYGTSQYGREYVIGRNCRFLQGPKTSTATVKRMIDALVQGQEICETILNYRRDGSPFMNLLMIAPLYDNKGNVRYFLGCQIDVSSLIDGGRGLESFEQLLAQDRSESRYGGRVEKSPAHALEDLGQMFSAEELNTVKSRIRSHSQDSGQTTPQRPGTQGGRRILGMEDTSDRNLWPHPSLGPSGRLPGVYQNYLLVRPYPSLRITFTSPALRIPGLLQSKFLDRVGGPQHVREGILDALAHGQKVTAKISWLTNQAPDHRGGSLEGKPRWIHCTPLMGSDDKVGVWMIVMVESEDITGALNARERAESGAMSPVQLGAATTRFTGGKLYTEYLRREGRADTIESVPRSVRSPTHSKTGIARREAMPPAADHDFRDF
ncbi:hypothetical protein LTR16_001912 [Cryomyces antarcticus]|uniref:PAC domain-containing protein n=1 Tax=Cryomyces antarcticus TaxID=329879 RepID=A0ABR0LYZ4_9PEZI|nr:hypothetical protein LTR16_001912 [Cryomyces antarcticus]